MLKNNKLKALSLTDFRFVFAITLVIGLSCAAQAETLDDAWIKALASDYSVAAANLRTDASSAELASARANRWPVITASASAMRFDDAPAFDFSGAGMAVQMPLFDGSSMVMTEARFNVPLFTSGMISNGIEAANYGYDAQRWQEDTVQQRVKMSVAEAYINVLRARSGLAVANSSVASLTAHLRDVEDMYSTGVVAKNDQLAASVSLAMASQRQLQAANGLDVANAAYNRATGRSLTETVDIDPLSPMLNGELQGLGLDPLTELALENRKELAGMRAAGNALEAQSRVILAQSRPHFGLTGGYTSFENNFLASDNYWSIGLGVQWRLFDGRHTRSKASAFSLQAQAMQNDMRDVLSMIKLEVRQTFLQFDEARARVIVTEKATQQAEENLRVVRDRYRNGEGTNTEVLDAEVLRNVSRSNFENAQFDVALTKYKLVKATGLL